MNSIINLSIFEDKVLCTNKKDKVISNLMEFVSGLMVVVKGRQHANGFVLKENRVICGATFGNRVDSVTTIYKQEVPAILDLVLQGIGLCIVETKTPVSSQQVLFRPKSIDKMSLFFRVIPTTGEPFVVNDSLVEHVKPSEMADLQKRATINGNSGTPILNEVGELEAVVCGSSMYHNKKVLLAISSKDLYRLLSGKGGFK